MSLAGDDHPDMTATWHIHDDVVETIIRGEPVHEVYAPLAAFAGQVRALGDAPAPEPSPELAAVMAGRPGRSRMPGIESVAGATGKVAGLGLIAKLGLGASLAAAGVAGAGAAGVLPAAASNAVRGAIEVVSPVDFGTDHPAIRPDNHGAGVSADAKGDSDGEPGVDGRAVSAGAPGAAHRAAGAPDEPPGQTGETGLTRANQTPAAPHAPDVAPGTQGGNGQAGTQPDDHTGSPPSQDPGSAHPAG